MVRVRISTTVDAERWAAARRLLHAPGSHVVDQALAALIEKLEGEHERAVLAAHPYEADEELAWQAGAGPDLPYSGAVPADVLEEAARRRSARD